ncbi:tropomyosin-1 isoform X2 [Sinocyclocheilus rhinocerous]|uniref:tropomyosin-1 isoform X2 n=1 Tax=Sinocyclocheilus rhinocerous TaxID=307959 RepID=UPI0007B9D63C|nr:PREDICTED: tropomyosin-1-like isoform X2 [Sinocyclocheilus rhinocerous]
MRRFFRVDRDEYYGQIQYLTAKCIRLSQEKAVLQRELLVSGERQEVLQAEMEGLSVRVCQKEQLYVELSIKYEQLLERFQKQQADLLQQHLISVTEERWRDASLLSLQLEQVSCDLQQLQGSEKQLMGLVDELHQEAQLRAQQAEVLETQLREETQKIKDLEMQLNRWQIRGKSLELMELQMSHEALRQDLCYQRSAHQRTVEELRRENSESLGKLRETAEQFEWLCEQQRRWMSCVKRFKDCLSGEKESLELQVNRLQLELDTVRNTVPFNRSTESCSRWDVEVTSDLQAEVHRWKRLYEDLLKLTTQQVQGQCAADGHLKPP